MGKSNHLELKKPNQESQKFITRLKKKHNYYDPVGTEKKIIGNEDNILMGECAFDVELTEPANCSASNLETFTSHNQHRLNVTKLKMEDTDNQTEIHRLTKIREMLRLSRKCNQHSVALEQRHLDDLKINEAKKEEGRQEIYKTEETKHNETKRKSPSLEKLTAEKAELIYRKEEKKGGFEGLEQLSRRAYFKAYEKRTAAIPHVLNNRKSLTTSIDTSNGTSLEHFLRQGSIIPEETVNHMVAELEFQAFKNKKFSRRRVFRIEQSIDSVNERNVNYNRKLERSFGLYTREIKENLEHRTAVPEEGIS